MPVPTKQPVNNAYTTPGSPIQLPTFCFPYLPNCHLSLAINLARKGQIVRKRLEGAVTPNTRRLDHQRQTRARQKKTTHTVLASMVSAGVSSTQGRAGAGKYAATVVQTLRNKSDNRVMGTIGSMTHQQPPWKDGISMSISIIARMDGSRAGSSGIQGSIIADCLCGGRGDG